MAATWEEVLTAIESKVPAPTFNRWFRSLSAREEENGEFYLVADDEFDAVFIEKNFSDLIRLHLERITGDPITLRILHDPEIHTNHGAGACLKLPTRAVSPPANGTPAVDLSRGPTIRPVRVSVTERILETGLKLQYAFDQYVVGSSNEFAHAACVAVADKPGQAYNPLFLYGSVGLGKTHLLNAIGIGILRKHPDKRVRYMTAEAFMNEMVDHLKTKNMSSFRSRFRDGLDALLIDDIQFIAGKEATQQEFFHTFNALHQTGAQIVITSDQFPHEIPDLEERLRSRFQWGLVADIQPPGIETRMAILKRKAETLDMELPDSAALFLAENIRSNVRELEGALLRLHAFVGFNDRVVTLELVRSLLRRFLQENNRQVTAEAVQKAVCNYYNLKLSDLRGKSRARAVSLPRQVAMYLSKKYTGLSYPQLGEKFGGRDHTTVLAGCRKIRGLVEKDKTISAAVQHLERHLTG